MKQINEAYQILLDYFGNSSRIEMQNSGYSSIETGSKWENIDQNRTAFNENIIKVPASTTEQEFYTRLEEKGISNELTSKLVDRLTDFFIKPKSFSVKYDDGMPIQTKCFFDSATKTIVLNPGKLIKSKDGNIYFSGGATIHLFLREFARAYWKTYLSSESQDTFVYLANSEIVNLNLQLKNYNEIVTPQCRVKMLTPEDHFSNEMGYKIFNRIFFEGDTYTRWWKDIKAGLKKRCNHDQSLLDFYQIFLFKITTGCPEKK